MFLLISNTTNPYFNIATEEYLLKHFSKDFAFLYINKPSLIVGKHQNTMAEINVPYVMENNIPVVRRLSGGGTVYHDNGNLNYCFIKQGKEGYLVDFKKYTLPVLKVLQKMKVNAYLKGKSDLVIEDRKFSGNAEHVYRNKILHHGTMLFNSDLGALENAIKCDWDKFSDKAVRSNRSVVTNIREHLNSEFNIEMFRDAFIQELNDESTLDDFRLMNQDVLEIQKLVDEKYSQWQWNFAYSPKYELKQKIKFNNQELSSELFVKKGHIEELCIRLNDVPQQKINTLIKGNAHDYHKVRALLNMETLSVPTLELLKVLF